MPLFRNRAEAGRELATMVRTKISDRKAVVLGLPRGGVPVAAEIARYLHLELDVFLVRKLGAPGHEELALGAIASGGTRVLNQELIEHLRVSNESMEALTAREEAELRRREQMYREGRPMIPVFNRTVILVDDGLATGASMLAASRALRQQHPKSLVVAVPVASRQGCNDFINEVDDVICAATPEPFGAVGIWYEDFSQTTDDEVRTLLEHAAHSPRPSFMGTSA
jgi:putative phosphoribosyl transferase